jgi:hypothetical protein
MAGEVNHADRRAKRKVEMLYNLSEALESALAVWGRVSF